MLARSGLIGCPCPVPVSLTSNLPSSMTPTLIHFPIRRSTLPSIPRFSIIPTHHFDNRLCHAISHGGHTQNPLSATLFGNGDGAHRRWKVGSRAHSVPDLVQVS